MTRTALVALVAALTSTLPGDARAQSMHEAHMAGAASTGVPTQAGQAAFAAISEVVALLEADPATDWSRVDIGALRDHLVDMDRVTLETHVTQRPVENGVEMTVSGAPDVLDAARRMVRSHAAMVRADHGWSVDVQDRGTDLVVTWTTPEAADVTRIRALGFFGFLVDGSHHPMHHLMIAKGMDPHAGM
jgi:hypothetical protein